MTFMDQEDIEKSYKKKDVLWGTKPNRYVSQLPKMLKKGKILDLGVGDGRNALYLAQKGFDVVGVDILKDALKNFLRFARGKNLKVKGMNRDISDYNFKEFYNAIICIGAIHFLNRQKTLLLIKRMKQQTLKEGINIIVAFTTDDEGNKTHPSLHFIQKGELEVYYKDWKILKNDYYSVIDNHDTPHKHHMMILMVEK
jgi:tellurite methyltransferase